VLNDAGLPVEAQVDRAYRLVHNRAPNENERTATLEFLQRQAPILGEQLARKEKVYLPDAMPAGIEAAHAAAVVGVCHALLSSNEFMHLN
jgi:hypothetical protein